MIAVFGIVLKKTCSMLLCCRENISIIAVGYITAFLLRSFLDGKADRVVSILRNLHRRCLYYDSIGFLYVLRILFNPESDHFVSVRKKKKRNKNILY